MKTIIAGSRTILDKEIVLDALVNSGFIITTIISGCAKGVDSIGENIGKDFGIPIEYYPANWDRYGRGAGHIRNEQMALSANTLIAIWDGRSPGTKGMIKIAKQLKLKVYIQNACDHKIP